MLASWEKSFAAAFVLVFHLALVLSAHAQSGNSTSITGTVLDPSGAVVAFAGVEIHNPVSGFKRTTATDALGKFTISNVPFNPYHLTVTGRGFAVYSQDVDVRSVVPVNLNIGLTVGTASETLTVEAAGDLVENDPIGHTDVDRLLFDKLPLESQSSSLSSLVTLATPGIAADSNGLFHGMGDHAENSFSLDDQPITDQQSKVFSNQVPLDSVQSLEVIAGAPPAEYGGKTSVVINVTTRSGQGMTTPHGAVTASYGTFGTSNVGFNLGYGGQKWGNFISANGLNSGRFLDPPEFAVMHDKGNEQNLFDRVDYQLSSADSLHLNFGFTRSWFQNPNSLDQEFHACVPGYPCNFAAGQIIGPDGNPLGAADQVSQIKTFNVAPTWTRLIGSNTVFTFGGFVRKDLYNYYPSADPFNDLAPDLQGETVSQNRKLTNAGLRSSLSYVKGIHNVKAGITYEHTFLTENDTIGIVDPTLLPSLNLLDANGVPIQNDPCLVKGVLLGPPCTILAPYDLTRGGGQLNIVPGLFSFHGHTDVKELALYLQDAITKGSWSFQVGVRGDFYNGLQRDRQAEPRLGAAYNIKSTNTVLRVSYARTLETPFNENLVIASTGCSNPFLATLVPPPGVPCNQGPIAPGYRNEFHAGLQQAFGRYLVVSGDYIWKYTHNGYDFGIVGSTPIYFPIEWHNSKIPGYAIRVSVPNLHGFSAQVVMSSVAARFFLPQVAGLPIIPPATGVFRIDHDELFNQTTHLQYQPWQRGPWFGFNWRYDSGLVAGATPCYNPLTATCAGASTMLNGQPAINLINTISGAPLTADQEFQAGFFCGLQHATPTQALPSPCLASSFGSTLIKVPAPNAENDDHNPQRIQPRSVFDASVGHDNLFHGDKYKVSAQLTVINLTNKYALYNFLSTFSGTHYVTPRAITAQIGFNF